MNILLLSAILLVGIMIGFCIGGTLYQGKPIKSAPPQGSILYVRHIDGERYIAVCDGKILYYQAVDYDPPVATGFHRMRLNTEEFPFLDFPDNVLYTPELTLLDQNLFKPQSHTA
jgi:hypothetical protein